MNRRIWCVAGASLLAAWLPLSHAAGKYDAGATDQEIKVGHINPYSGPASAYGAIGQGIQAYIKKVNDEGGVNGRKINLISLDDGYSPPKTVEQARRLVEQDKVLLLFAPLGTPTNSAIHKYMNAKKVPHLFVQTGATKWGDPKNFPWTMGWQPNYQSEGVIYAQAIMENQPNAKIAILYQNDDYGKDYITGMEMGLGNKKSMIVAKESYETTDPTVDSQVVKLKSSGADVFLNVATPKFAAQAIKKVAELGWKPVHYLNSVSSSVGSVLTPAGLNNSVGLITTQYIKDPTDPQWQSAPDFVAYKAFLAKYLPSANINDAFYAIGYANAQTLVQTLKQCGDELTHANVMKQAANLKNFVPGMLLPGVNVETGPDDFFPIERMQLSKFDGQKWVLFGKVFGR